MGADLQRPAWLLTAGLGLEDSLRGAASCKPLATLGDLRAPTSLDLRTHKSNEALESQIELETLEASELDSNELLDDPEDSKPLTRKTHHARKILSLSTFTGAIVDFTMSIAALYFVALALLVYSRRGKPADGAETALLEAINFSLTIFPILFATIAANFLRAYAAFKLERGASVSTVEHLLNSRTVSSAFTTPLSLKTFNTTTMFLIFLWALSPLGGQAGLRVVSTGPMYTNASHEFQYLAFLSDYTTPGASVEFGQLLQPINTAFSAAVAGSSQAKAASQDQNGNIKIPFYEYLNPTSPGTSAPWRQVPTDGSVLWSSLTGLPVNGLPLTGTSRFELNTGYMLADCKLSSRKKLPTEVWTFSLVFENYTKGSNDTGPGVWNWSGADFAVGWDEISNLTFVSFYDPMTANGTSVLTTAHCNLTMSYVMVQIECWGQSCSSLAMKPSTKPAIPEPIFRPLWSTPLAGQGQQTVNYLGFFENFVTATNPKTACDTATCPASMIEGYLVDPLNPFPNDVDGVQLSKVDEKIFSQRLAQLLNTYWIDGIAPLAIFMGLGHTNPVQPFNVGNSTGTIQTQRDVVKCNIAWFAVSILVSVTLFLIGAAATVLNMLRRGPRILDSFSSLIRDNQYCTADVSHESSMEDATDQSKRLKDLVIRLGDVKPDEEVGHVALGVVNGSRAVKKLNLRRKYD